MDINGLGPPPDLTLLAHLSLESLAAGLVVVKDKLGRELDFDYAASISILVEKNGSVSWLHSNQSSGRGRETLNFVEAGGSLAKSGKRLEPEFHTNGGNKNFLCCQL